MKNENEYSEETIAMDEPITVVESSTKEDSIKMTKCCSECNCTGYDQDHGNICTCGHNSERHIC